MSITAPTQPIGYVSDSYTGAGNWWSFDPNETTLELQWPQSVYIFDQMRRQDAQVGSVLEAVCRPVLRTPWRIDPAGARDEVTEFVAEDLGLPIVGENPEPPARTKDRFSWTEHLELALLMLPFGHSYFEVVYRITDDGSRAHLGKLELRPARTIEQIDVARDGGLISITQYQLYGSVQKPITVDRLVAYIYKKEGANWLGRSILRQAYKNWLIKDRLLRVQAQTIERNGMGIPLYKAAENGTDVQKAEGLAMAKAWRAGEAAGSAVPFGADLILRGVEGDLPDALPAIKYHDEQIARAVLAHFLNLDNQSHGSYALGTSFMDFFTLSLQTLAQSVADVASMHIVEDLVDVNWGPEEPAPRIVFDEIGSRQAATAASVKTLVDAGIITPDKRLEESSRQQYGLPPAEPETARDPKAPTPSGGSITLPSSPPSTPTERVEARAPYPGQKWHHGWIPAVGFVTHLLGSVGEARVWHDPDDGDGPVIELAVGSAEYLHDWDRHITTPWDIRLSDDQSREVDFHGEDIEDLRKSLNKAADAAAGGRRYREEHFGSDHGRLLVESDGTAVILQNRHLDDPWHFEDDAEEQLTEEAWQAHWATHPPSDEEDDWTPTVTDAQVNARAKALLARFQHPSTTLSPDQVRQLAQMLTQPGKVEARGFNPHQPRVPGGEHGGEWASVGGIAGKIRDLLASLVEGDGIYYHGTRGDLSGPGREIFITDRKDAALGYLEGGQGKVYALRLSPQARIAGEDDLSRAADDIWGDVEQHFGYQPYTYELADQKPVRDWLRGHGFAGAEFVDLGPNNAYEHPTIVVWDRDALTTEASVEIPRHDRSALVEVRAAAKFNPQLHPRGAEGRFRTTLDRIVHGLRRWAEGGGKGDPFGGFTREQLRRTAVARGIKLQRGASEHDIRDHLLVNLRDALAGDVLEDRPGPVKKVAKKAAPKAPQQLGLRHADAETMYDTLTGPKFDLLAGPDVGLIGDERLVLSREAVERLRLGEAGQDGTIEDTASGPAIWFFGELLPLRSARARSGGGDQPEAKPSLAKKATSMAPRQLNLAKLRKLDDPEAIRDALDLHKVPELKDALRGQKLPLSGRKRELVDRLVEHLGGGTDKPEVKTAGPKLSNDPDVRAVQIENRIREAWNNRPEGSRYVGLADLRESIGPDVSRSEVDAALTSLSRQPGVSVAPADMGSTFPWTVHIGKWGPLQQRDHDAALVLGGTPRHMIAFADPAGDATMADALTYKTPLRPLPLTKKAVPAKKATAYELAPGYRGPTARARHNQREEALLTVDKAGKEGLGPAMGATAEALDALKSTGYVRWDGRHWHLTDKGRMYVDAHGGKTGPDLEQQARARFAEIDAKRKVADMLTEALGLVHNEADEDVARRRIAGLALANGVDDATRDALLAAADQAREVEVENRVRAAYRDAAASSGREHLIPLADIRERLAGLDRSEVDAALIRMARGGTASLTPNEDRKRRTQRDRDAALRIPGYGSEDANDWLTFDDASPQPSPLTETTQRLARDAGLTPVAQPGQVVPFDRKLHESIYGSPQPGEKVGVEEAGYSLKLSNGETVRLSKAKVSTYDPKLHGPEPEVAKTPRKRAPKEPTGRTPAAPVVARDLFTAEDATIETALRDVFEGQFGPYTTKATVRVIRAGTRTDKRGREHKIEPSVSVEGKIYDADGTEIGYFGRSISPVDMHYTDGTVRREVWANHSIVQLGGGDYDENPTRYHGTGFGGEFNRRAIEWYRASGVHGIGQHDHNGYVWASQGFNFGNGGKVPDYLAENIRTLIADLRAAKTVSEATKDEYRTIPKRFLDAPDLQAQIAAAEALLERISSTKLGEPGYPTAYEISQLGRRQGQHGRTALWLGKLLFVSADELILNPDEGEVVGEPGGAASGARVGAVLRSGTDISRDHEVMASIYNASIDENGSWIQSAEGDPALIGLARRQGFDGTPTVLASDEFDRVVAEGGHAVMWRGVNPDSFWGEGKWAKASGADVHAQVREGDYRPGYGVFGNGYYFATDREKAESFSDGQPGSLGRYALAADARTVDYEDLYREYGEYFDSDYTSDPLETQGMSTDMGRFAASRGYDAIRVRVGTRMLGGGIVQREEWVVLNRAALIADRGES